MVVVGGQRMGSLQNCDKIIVLQCGVKVEEGTHNELMRIPVTLDAPQKVPAGSGGGRTDGGKYGGYRRRVLGGLYHHAWNRCAAEAARGRTDSAALQVQIRGLEEELAMKQARADKLRRQVMLPFFAAIWVARFPHKVRKHRLRRMRRKKSFMA
jgi:hypothetical protein